MHEPSMPEGTNTFGFAGEIPGELTAAGRRDAPAGAAHGLQSCSSQFFLAVVHEPPRLTFKKSAGIIYPKGVDTSE